MKLTLTRYLQGRGEVKALTHIEALAFGVPYPLQPGWPSRHGETEITDAMIEDLKARIATAKEKTASKARRGLEGIGETVLARGTPQAQTFRESYATVVPAVTAPVTNARSAVFPGFALRQARRYRSRASAPWT